MYRRSQRWMLIINNRFLSLYDYNFLLVIEKIWNLEEKYVCKHKVGILFLYFVLLMKSHFQVLATVYIFYLQWLYLMSAARLYEFLLQKIIFFFHLQFNSLIYWCFFICFLRHHKDGLMVFFFLAELSFQWPRYSRLIIQFPAFAAALLNKRASITLLKIESKGKDATESILSQGLGYCQSTEVPTFPFLAFDSQPPGTRKHNQVFGNSLA